MSKVIVPEHVAKAVEQENLQKAEKEYREISLHIRDEKINDLIKNINNTLSDSLKYTASSIGHTGSRLGTEIVKKTRNIAEKLGETSFKYGVAPLVEKYSERRLRNIPVGTNDYHFYSKLKRSAQTGQLDPDEYQRRVESSRGR